MSALSADAVSGGGSVTPPPHRTTSDVLTADIDIFAADISTTVPATIVDTVSWSIPEMRDGTNPFAQALPEKVLKTIMDETHTATPRERELKIKNAVLALDSFKQVRMIRDVILSLFPKGVEWSSFEKGTQGYSRQMKLVSGSLVLGWAQFGADHGKMWLYLTGVGLRLRRDAGHKDADLAVINDIDGSKLTRIDIALDIYDHATFSVQEAMQAYEVEKNFYETTSTPVRRASDAEKQRYAAAREQIMAWKHLKSPVMPFTTNYESRRGDSEDIARTFYIGKLDGPKMVRVYDKGLQLLGKFSDEKFESYRKDGVIASSPVPYGCKVEEYTRVELVLRDKGKQVLDPAILTDTDSYFAGGFPMLAKLLEVADGVRPSYIPREEECVHARMIEAHRDSYGGHVFHMSKVLGWSDHDIIRRIIGTKSSARLMTDQERPTDD